MTTLEDIKAVTEFHQYDDYITLLCPFHDDRGTPSCFAYPDGFFICKACGEQGNIRRLYEALAGQTDRPQLVQKRDEGHRLPPWSDKDGLDRLVDDAHRFMAHYPSLRYYLVRRKIEPIWKRCRLGWHDGWLVVPIYSRAGGVQGVVLRATGNSRMRFDTPKGQPPLMYAPDWARLKTQPVIFLVHGVVDALTLCSLDVAVVTATAGQDSFKAEWLNDYRKPIIDLPDLGEERSATLNASRLDWRGNVGRLDYPEGCKDPNDFVVQGHKDKLILQLARLERDVLRRTYPGGRT